MTFNRDPDTRMRDRLRVRRDDGTWSAIPLLVVLAIAIGLGAMIFMGDWTTTNDRPVTAPRTTPPATSTPPATTPPAGPRQ